jgi:hypothetical protein
MGDVFVALEAHHDEDVFPEVRDMRFVGPVFLFQWHVVSVANL